MTAEIRAEGRALFENPVALAMLRSRLLRYASRDLSDADAEDATQEALLGLLCALDRYRGASQIDTYAHAMLRHKVVDVYRAHARELPCPPETLQALIDLSADVTPDSGPSMTQLSKSTHDNRRNSSGPRSAFVCEGCRIEHG